MRVVRVSLGMQYGEGRLFCFLKTLLDGFLFFFSILNDVRITNSQPMGRKS